MQISSSYDFSFNLSSSSTFLIYSFVLESRGSEMNMADVKLVLYLITVVINIRNKYTVLMRVNNHGT